MMLEVIAGVSILFLYLYYKLSKNKNYWLDRGVQNTGFKFFWGDDSSIFKQTEAMHTWATREYKRFANLPYFGCWTLFGKPYLMIRNDFELIRSIWVKDFDHFAAADSFSVANKETWPATKAEKLVIHNIQSAQGDEWKDIR